MPLSPRQADRLAQRSLGDGDGDDGRPERRADAPEPALGAALPLRVGGCRILRLLAAGGMGVVYEAEQDRPRRIVAVKVMSRPIAARGKSALRRFEYEAELLSRLDHPGIARIYEAGTHDDGTGGVPYFVMELIPDARDLIEFADAHGLTPRQRLQLFVKVCDAVQHGHQKGIIHRDLKPGNVLVQERARQTGTDAIDEAAQPKVIDFGVARAADADISLTTMHTRPGEVVGTLQYMSPEQCEGDPHTIDVRSDVYSLGVTLYELLCGRRPYDLSEASVPRATRIIQEQEPPRPSTIHPTLRGNLEAITLKAIEKKPAGRYQSAADLAGDIRRHLAGEPIEARRPGRWVRAARFVVRHPVLMTVGVCSSVLLLTVAATWLSVWYMNVRPHHVELAEDGREARVVSFGSRILHMWHSPQLGGIRFADLLPAPHGGGGLVVLGFKNGYDERWPGALCAFDLRGDLDAPVWQNRIEERDLIGALRAGGIDVAGFGISSAISADVFAEVPGPEIVAMYSHTPGSAGVIAIYDTAGNRLYRVWHDGAPGDCYWMDGARRLVFVTQNCEASWPARGHADLVEAPPIVVFALKPSVGHDGQTWTTTSDGGDTATLAWYQCLLPPDASNLVQGWYFMRPPPRFDPGRFVTFGVNLHDGSGVSWVLDGAGQEVPGTRTWNDKWRLTKQLPDDYFRLGELPPVTGAVAPPK